MRIVKGLNEIVLSAFSRICKTERFIVETARFLAVDAFITHFAEGLIKHYASMKNASGFLKLSTDDGKFTLYAARGKAVKNAENEEDIIFYDFVDKGEVKRSNDSSLLDYLKERTTLVFNVENVPNAQEEAFAKLYLLTGDDQVNFPLLNAEQLKIVTTENANVLAQGVAGSGKTNVCIDKIIYSASRGYHGNVLYTTFSRGLLIDTETKINLFKKNVGNFLAALRSGKVFFYGDKKKAVENKLGIFLNVEGASIDSSLKDLMRFLNNQVHFKLLRDFVKPIIFADEEYFIKVFLDKNRHAKGNLNKIGLSYEVAYKEIYGIIFGYAEGLEGGRYLPLDTYVKMREESFSKKECETVYAVAMDYSKFLVSTGAMDNNSISRLLLGEELPLYSLTIIDEVQDLTQINLAFLNKISRKIFAVGDALQMINPSFFSFAYLKRLLYSKDEIAVSELKNNYRNTQSVAEIVNNLSDLNVKKFGLHNFVLKGVAIGDDDTKAVYLRDEKFAEKLAKEKPNPFTIVVTGAERKAELRRLLPKQEILTVSEIKGLERDTALLYNLLSDNADKWRTISETSVNRKKADENSVYRYYFNLFYVGISRAKKNLFVVEKVDIDAFKDFFKESFDVVNAENGVDIVLKTVSKTDVDRDELVKRIDEFLKFGQYDNAVFTADKLQDDAERKFYLSHIEIHKKYLQDGDYRGAGIAYWELGDLDRAKKNFELSGDDELIDLVDKVAGKGEGRLSAEVVKFYPELMRNEAAKNLILDALKNDLTNIKNEFKAIKGMRKHGKK